jgi:hypothetical protein
MSHYLIQMLKRQQIKIYQYGISEPKIPQKKLKSPASHSTRRAFGLKASNNYRLGLRLGLDGLAGRGVLAGRPKLVSFLL